ncbi:replication protein [Aeromonas hydrophila]|uniref:replication protein n=1 Tax=Aeromonas hydrophila TaxID=644 RepID=UPI00067DAF8E|nr:replication protein [Aeromonas hydrophila]
MADVENGYTRIANELYDAINLADLNRNELKVAHAIARATCGFNKRFDRISDNQIAARTGLSRQAVSYAKNSLLRMKVLVWEGSQIGVNSILSDWDISDCHRKSDTVRETMTKSVRETVTRLSGKVGHTKDIITKEKRKILRGYQLALKPHPPAPRENLSNTPHSRPSWMPITSCYQRCLEYVN